MLVYGLLKGALRAKVTASCLDVIAAPFMQCQQLSVLEARCLMVAVNSVDMLTGF